MKTGDRPEISAVIPCLNEAENAAAIARAVAAELEALGVAYEIIFIDNGSTDGTVAIVKGLCASDERIRLIVNTRNFGQMRSPTHAIYQASGDAVIGISADFQDPPELIGPLVARWRAGAMIVLGVRASEDTSWFLNLIRAVGYGFFARFGDYRVVPGATGFGLYDRRVVDCLRTLRDPEPFFRGMLAESGFSLETIPYHRPQRAGGVSKNNLFSLLSFALSGLASSSKNLLRLPFYFALVFSCTTFVTLVAGVVIAILGRAPWLMLGLALGQAGFAAICFFLGFIGEQVRIISEIVRNTPLVVERERVNFPSSNLESGPTIDGRSA
ncbi:MAG TPA: glycosyltransferase family 2 protein [Caulobacteraceae bacterium]|nr:glycosyltransferase family 2 protein [Caulobacteraceae bacterium]